MSRLLLLGGGITMRPMEYPLNKTKLALVVNFEIDYNEFVSALWDSRNFIGGVYKTKTTFGVQFTV